VPQVDLPFVAYLLRKYALTIFFTDNGKLYVSSPHSCLDTNTGCGGGTGGDCRTDCCDEDDESGDDGDLHYDVEVVV